MYRSASRRLEFPSAMKKRRDMRRSSLIIVDMVTVSLLMMVAEVNVGMTTRHADKHG